MVLLSKHSEKSILVVSFSALYVYIISFDVVPRAWVLSIEAQPENNVITKNNATIVKNIFNIKLFLLLKVSKNFLSLNKFSSKKSVFIENTPKNVTLNVSHIYYITFFD